MKVSFHGHAIIKIETQGKTILFDPFINGNDLTDLVVDEVKPDVIILTHGHNDHVGDTVELAKKHDALVIANADLATVLSWQGVERIHSMNIGGAYEFEFGKVKMTPALHGSGYTTVDNQLMYCGQPAGILFTAEGKTIYHAGDTALYSDMKLIGERHPIDVAFVPIGDNFTMGPEDAALAIQFLQAKLAVPIHYDTFPPIKQNPHLFLEVLPNGNGHMLKPGELIVS